MRRGVRVGFDVGVRFWDENRGRDWVSEPELGSSFEIEARGQRLVLWSVVGFETGVGRILGSGYSIKLYSKRASLV